MTGSYQERSAWVQALSLLGVGAVYLAHGGSLLARGITGLGSHVPVFVIGTVLLIIALAVGHTLVTIWGTDDPDERDKLISWKAGSRSSWLLAVFALASIGGLIFEVQPVLIAHALFTGLLLTELLTQALRITGYKTGG